MKCYLCTVEDGNTTPFDSEKHALCLLCTAKLRQLAIAEVAVPFAGRWVEVFLGEAVRGHVPTLQLEVEEEPRG